MDASHNNPDAAPAPTPAPTSAPPFFPKNDIVEFIHQESLTNKTQSNQVIIETYACTLWKGFFDMKHKLRDIAELDGVHAVDMGIQLIDNLFWIIYHYSSNVQLTLFLTERGRLLYTEFLYMSRTHQLMKELNTFPSIQDGFQFAIKKSIGSLTCQTHSTNMLFQHISSYRGTYRRMFQILNRKYLVGTNETPWTDDQVNLTLHMLNHRMSCAIHHHVSVFEHCIYGAYDKTLTVSGFLLLLQLLADVSAKHLRHTSEGGCGSGSGSGSESCAWGEDVVRAVFAFVHEHRSYIGATSLDCLERGHLLQHKWTLYRALVLQRMQEDDEVVGGDGSSSSSEPLSDSLESLSEGESSV